MIIKSRHAGYTADGIRRVFMGGGGGGGTQTSYQTNIPEYAQKPFMELVGKSQALSEAGYKPYTGERVAGFTPLQQQAFQSAQGMQVAPQTGVASGLAGLSAQRALGSQYEPSQFYAPQVAASGLSQYQMGPAQAVRADIFGGRQAAQYMSPYIQEALAPQMREAVRASDIQRNVDQAKAVGAGAYGGSRQALVEAERQRNLGTQLGDIQARGLQTAYEQATQQFNQDAARRLQAQQLNQQAGLTVGQQNLNALLGVQQLGAQQGLQAQQLNQQAALDAQRMAEQSRQYGAGYGMQGLQTALQGAQQLGALGAQQFGQQKDITGLQAQYGAQQQQLEQARLNQGYADYQAAQEYPYKQLGFMSDILRGTQGTTRTMYEPVASPMQQLVGAGTAMYGASKVFAEGGDVDYTQGGVFQGQGQGQDPRLGSPLNFARGGKVSSGRGIEALVHDMQYLPPNLLEQKARAAQSNDLRSYLAAKIAEQEQQKIRAGAQAQQALNAPPPQGTVVQQDLANSGIAAVAPQSAGQFADGGIVSFAGGEEVPPPKTSGQRMWRSFENYMQEQNPFGPSGIATSIGDTLSSWKGGPEAATQADEEAPSIYASPEEWAAYRARQPQIAQQRAENANELQRMRNRVATQAVERKASPAPAVSAPQGQPGRTVPNPLADAAQTTLRKADAVASKPTGAAPSAGARVSMPTGSTRAELAGIDKLIADNYGELESGARKLSDEQRAYAEGRKQRFEEDIAKLGKLGEKQEARLKKEEEGLAGRKEEAKGSALMQAGLAILSADPKRGLAAAIGTGGQAGLAAYKADAEKIQAAQDKINEGMDRLDQLRRAEDMATGKERRGYEDEIHRTKVDLADTLLKLKGDKSKVSIDAKLKGIELLQQERLKIMETQAYRDVGLARSAGSGAAADSKLGAAMDKAADNARARLDSLVKSNPRLARDSVAYNAKYRELLNEELAMVGQVMPGLAKAAPTSGAAPSQTVYDFAKIGK